MTTPGRGPEPGWVCPVCRYPNQSLNRGRCLRCGAPLLLPLACSGACSACVLAPAGGCAQHPERRPAGEAPGLTPPAAKP